MGPWTSADLERLAILAETFVAGGDVDGRARLAATALAEVTDPAQLRQLRLALRAMDSRAANLALTGHPTGIGAMDAAQRERYLRAWGTSRIAQRRSAFGALRKLLVFLAYAPPAGAPPGPLAAVD